MTVGTARSRADLRPVPAVPDTRVCATPDYGRADLIDRLTRGAGPAAPWHVRELAERLGPPTYPPDPRIPCDAAPLPHGEVPGGTHVPIPGGALTPEMAHSLIEDVISSTSEGASVVVTPWQGILIPKEVGR